MALTDTKARTAKPTDKQYKLYDEKGLLLLVHTNGSKYWRFKYRYNNKEKNLSLGVYPEVTLKKARTKRDRARELLADGVDPSLQKQIDKGQSFEDTENSFKKVAEEWFIKRRAGWSEGHIKRQQRILNKDLYPWIGNLPIGSITATHLLSALRRIESRGANVTAKRARQLAGMVFRYGIAIGVVEHDPSQGLKDALATHVTKHRAAITDPKEVGPLLKALDSYQGTPVVRAALKLAPLTFVRPGELRKAEWSEIDFENCEWHIPATHMKVNREHIIPLSNQSIAILNEILPLTGSFKHVFPNARSPRRAMSDNAVLGALRNLDIPKERMCGHGFRAMARTILDEVLHYNVDWIEHQLAHAVRDVHGRAYNRTAHLEGRKEMMQSWADYLDECKGIVC